MEKEKYYIYHYCLNENRDEKNDPDYCFRAWVDEAPNAHSCSQQNWKYCEFCEAKGYPKFTLKDRVKGLKIRQEMINALQRYKGKKEYEFKKRKPMSEEQRKKVAENFRITREKKSK